jgi:hypothetical protein
MASPKPSHVGVFVSPGQETVTMTGLAMTVPWFFSICGASTVKAG